MTNGIVSVSCPVAILNIFGLRRCSLVFIFENMIGRRLLIDPVSRLVARWMIPPTLVSCWISFIGGFVNPWLWMVPVLLTLRLLPGFRQRNWIWLLFTPFCLLPVLGVLRGSWSYFSGHPVFRSTGLPGEEFYNLDPVYRVGRVTSGCVSFGGEAFSQVPHNLAVKFWVMVLGKTPGVYTGHYPGREETAGLLQRQGMPVEVFFEEGVFRFTYEGRDWRFADIPHRPFSSPDARFMASVCRGGPELILFCWKERDGVTVYSLAECTGGKVFARYMQYPRRPENS